MSGDHGEWAACWEVHGIRADDGLSVSVGVGVIDLEGRHTVAISVADESPVALTDRLTDEAAELLSWAKEERDMLADLRAQHHTADLKSSLNRAVLTHRQWQKIRNALEHNTSDSDMATALNALRNAAPPGWAEE